jgi:dipeptidyl aminopeptidase/acylaminoacyl peptidase
MRTRLLLKLALLPLSAFGAELQAGCTDLLPDGAPRPSAIRPLEADDLFRLRDIGFPDGSITGPSPLAVSPDGNEVAFVLTRADPAANRHCRGLVVVPIGGGPARMIDAGGDFIPLRTFVRGLSVEVGLPALNVPLWSPDGRSIAYLKRAGDVTQAWIAQADGSSSRQVTRVAADVESLWWAADGRRLLFASRRSTAAARQQIEAEGQGGWLYDGRFTNAGPWPQLREQDLPVEVSVLELATGAIRPATSAEAARHGEGMAPGTRSRSGRRAWTEQDTASLLSPRRLLAAGPNGHPVRCNAAACLNPDGMWWDEAGQELRFLRREGWNRDTYALYRWLPGDGDPVQVWTSQDAIQNCVTVSSSQLVCTRENAISPRQVVALDPATGETQLVFEPNPEFGGIRLGSVQRLRVRNEQGLEAWADLALPPGHRDGEQLPMVIVQYQSRGFLRGGTGDEVPIHLFAARGFAVLSFERPPAVATASNPRSEVEANAANQTGWAERRSVHAALLAAIDAAIATGNVDPRRIGITGLSDGATAVRFALINSGRFAAASIGSCCVEPLTAMAYGGPAFAAFNRAIGYPPLNRSDPDFWRPMALSLNAGRIEAPLLMQLADEEFILSLEAYAALAAHGAPVELFVFPNEHHVKWQPIHRRAVYSRNLDWFDFWLRCREDPDPAKRAQYERWRRMRAQSSRAASLCPGGN